MKNQKTDTYPYHAKIMFIDDLVSNDKVSVTKDKELIYKEYSKYIKQMQGRKLPIFIVGKPMRITEEEINIRRKNYDKK